MRIDRMILEDSGKMRAINNTAARNGMLGVVLRKLRSGRLPDVA